MSAKGTAVHQKSDYFDGPAIAHCPTYNALIEDARTGSTRLLIALQRTGLRPC